MTPMSNAEHSSIQTRPSLLNRLSTGDDAEGWHEFYRVYGKLVRDFAIKAGLSDTEADEVVTKGPVAKSVVAPCNWPISPPASAKQTLIIRVVL